MLLICFDAKSTKWAFEIRLLSSPTQFNWKKTYYVTYIESIPTKCTLIPGISYDIRYKIVSAKYFYSQLLLKLFSITEKNKRKPKNRT